MYLGITSIICCWNQMKIAKCIIFNCTFPFFICQEISILQTLCSFTLRNIPFRIKHCFFSLISLKLYFIILFTFSVKIIKDFGIFCYTRNFFFFLTWHAILDIKISVLTFVDYACIIPSATECTLWSFFHLLIIISLF